MGSTPTTTVDVDAARELISAALSTYAEVVADQIDRSDDPAADQSDLVLLAELAGNVTGWTHTTRLREFLQAHAPEGGSVTAAQEQTAARVAAAHDRYRTTAVELAEAYVAGHVDERTTGRFVQARIPYTAAVEAWEQITAAGDIDAQLRDVVASLGPVNPRLHTSPTAAEEIS